MGKTLPPLSEKLPLLIFGTATFNHQYNKDPFSLGSTALVRKALQSGIRAFDSSPYYGPAEELLGEALNTDDIRQHFPRESYFILTKCGRIGGDEFDYSPAWIRQSVKRSLERLHTTYLDVVYCHDVEFVSPHEVLAAVRELRRIRDEEGTIKYVGISAFPLDVLCRLSEQIVQETGEPVDIVMSYANFTLQNTTLAHKGVQRLKAAGVDVVPNASPLGMGLLRRAGPPIGVTDFHPAGQELRSAVRRASAFCDSHDERIEAVAIRYALEQWLRAGAAVGSKGPTTSGVPEGGSAVPQNRTERLGVSVIGTSTQEELDKTLQEWHSILDGLEHGQQVADAAGRWKHSHEWSVNRRKAVELLAEGVRESLGDWVDYAWPSPSPGFVNKRQVEGA